MASFKSLGLADPILRGVKAAGYTNTTPIQAQAIPAARKRRDLIGCAQTGTGKTAAFVLPLLDQLLSKKHKKRSPLRALIIAPTRELALQITEAIRIYGKFTRLSVCPIYGGVDIRKQTNMLRRGMDIVVATPGRLIDHMERGNIDLGRVEIVVLDEADRMLDMGFIHDIRRIMNETPVERQTMLFSATMPAKVEDLAQHILHDPELIQVGKRRNPADSVEQSICTVKQVEKIELLTLVLRREPVEKAIVFARTKYRADKISRKLKGKGFTSIAMHSGRSQQQRKKALEGFQKGKYSILVATNIAARGIDVDGVSHVINYDIPEEAESYIHRIGRTGRGDADGRAITFVAETDYDRLRDIEKHIGKRIDRLDYPGLTDHVEPRKTRENQRPKSEARKAQKSSGRRRGRNKKPKFKPARTR